MMLASSFEHKYNEFVGATVRRTKRMADRAMCQFIVLRISLVVTSASLPAFTTFANPGWSTAAAVSVAILAGLDTQFRWGEEWRHFRSTQNMLERLDREFHHRSAALEGGRTIGDIQTSAQNFDKFHRDVEELLQSESDRFFKFRVVEWKAPTA
jgi:hypothetical protein